jgi:hypothetical protein
LMFRIFIASNALKNVVFEIAFENVWVIDSSANPIHEPVFEHADG